MSKEISTEIYKALAFIEHAEKSLNVTMLKSRHAPVELNQALQKIGEAKVLLEKGAQIETEVGDTYE